MKIFGTITGRNYRSNTVSEGQQAQDITKDALLIPTTLKGENSTVIKDGHIMSPMDDPHETIENSQSQTMSSLLRTILPGSVTTKVFREVIKKGASGIASGRNKPRGSFHHRLH